MPYTYENVAAGTVDDRHNPYDRCLCKHSRTGHSDKKGNKLICRWCRCSNFKLFQKATWEDDDRTELQKWFGHKKGATLQA